MISRIFAVAVCATYFSVANSDAGFTQDTYINALQNSHQNEIDNNSGGYQYTPPNNNYLPPPTPAPSYGPPAPAYGPPAPVYGYPSPVYGPPTSFSKPASIAFHSNDHWFLDKIKSKISLFAIGKIILKLLIFKKIVKFIGIICLLLFLPKLKNMFKDDTMDEDGMESKHGENDRDILEKQVDEVHKFVLKAMESYQEHFK